MWSGSTPKSFPDELYGLVIYVSSAFWISESALMRVYPNHMQLHGQLLARDRDPLSHRPSNFLLYRDFGAIFLLSSTNTAASYTPVGNNSVFLDFPSTHYKEA